MTTFCYHPSILAALAEHGLQPLPTTPPDRAHEFVSDLYRFELRRLRDRLVRREIPKQGYLARVVEVRRRYPVLSVRLEHWAQAESESCSPADDC